MQQNNPTPEKHSQNFYKILNNNDKILPTM